MRKLMLGNEAVARGAYEAGVRVVSAYPGTPSTEVSEYISKYDEVYAEWAPNEKGRLSRWRSARPMRARAAMVCMKHVGVNVAADPLFTAAYTGVNGGLVMLAADDPGMHSSQNEQDTRFYARSAHIPLLEPADSAEAKEFDEARVRALGEVRHARVRAHDHQARAFAEFRGDGGEARSAPPRLCQGREQIHDDALLRHRQACRRRSARGQARRGC